MKTAVEFQHISKRFGAVQANHDVNFSIASGSIHGIIGENGAGKSTLMSILYGYYRADHGQILLNGQPTELRNSHQAIEHGIGMVHQHFMLADNATVLENIVLGSEPMKAKVVVDYAKARENLENIIKTYGLEINPDDLVSDLGVGFRQRVEIAKVLFRGAKILILDEPTAVLVPQEVDELFKNLKVLTANGLTIIFISHKLDEVMAIADSISVMRRGTTVAELVPSKTSKKELAEYMIGGELPAPRPATMKPREEKVLVVKDASLNDRTGRESLHSINLEIHAGEILGLAGVEGNGQDELIEMIMGLENRLLEVFIPLDLIPMRAHCEKFAITASGISRKIANAMAS